jgi:hypothetical protein
MHGFDFIPALHQDINHNRIYGAVLLRRGVGRFFFSARRAKHCSGMPVSPAKFDNSGGLVSVNLSACWLP